MAEEEDDDEIQEVAPTIVKSEPRDTSTLSASTTTAMAATAADSVVVGGASDADYGSNESSTHGGEVALEDSYQDESYDYGSGDYGDVSFGGDDGSGHVIDPTTGMPLAAGASDGNKGRIILFTIVRLSRNA